MKFEQVFDAVDDLYNRSENLYLVSGKLRRTIYEYANYEYTNFSSVYTSLKCF